MRHKAFIGAILTVCAASAAMMFSQSLIARESWPVAPEDVKAKMDSFDQHEKDLLAKLKPEMDEWAKKGKPYLPWASKPSDLPQAEIPAFPGAEGGGMYSYGGHGGKIYLVTNLEDSGPGSLREGIEAAGPHVVVFNVAGIIRLKMPLYLEALPYITIAGQTTPGDGICIANYGIIDNAHDVIIRYIRMRPGSSDIYYRHGIHYGNVVGNILLDHVSASWGNDQNMDTYRHMYQPPEGGPALKLPAVNVTIQWCITSEGLNTWNHAFGGDWGGRNTGFHHNLFACNTGRNPSIAMGFDFNFVNNVLFNWRHRTLDGGDETSMVNVINNYYKPGPETPNGAIRYRVGEVTGRQPVKNGPQVWGKWYAAGNIVEGNAKVTADNWAGGIQFSTGTGSEDAPTTGPTAQDVTIEVTDPRSRDLIGRVRQEKPFPMPPITIDPAKEAYDRVVADAGASLPKRDAVDERVIMEVMTGQTWGMGQAIPTDAPANLPKNDIGVAGNGIITDIAQVGGYPDYKGEPQVMTQKDGIPDWWKKKYNMDVNDPTLASKDSSGDGYSNLEKYLDGLDPTKKVDWKDLKNNVNTLTDDKLHPVQ